MRNKTLIRLYKPQIHVAQTTSLRMWLLSLCAILAIFQSSARDAFSSLIIAATTVAVAVIAEALIYFRTERSGTLKDGSAIASALVLTLLLPNNIHPIYAAMGAAFAMAVVKHSFGGLGSNWLNPAVGGWLFIRLSWPEVFNNSLEGSPLVLISQNMGRPNPDNNPLGVLSAIGHGYGTYGDMPLDNFLRLFFGEWLFSFARLEFPEAYIGYFNASAVGIIADRGIFALLLGTIFFTAIKVNRAWVPAVFLGVYMTFVRIFGAIPYGGALFEGDLFFAVFSGGVIVSAFLLVCDHATGPKSVKGVLATSALGGFFAFLFRYYGAEVYGAILAIVIVNTIVPFIRDIESKYLYKDKSLGSSL